MLALKAAFLVTAILTGVRDSLAVDPSTTPFPLSSSGINVCGHCDENDDLFYLCCLGWSQGPGDEGSCLTPECSPPCENGDCTSPDVCTCLPGYVGEKCDIVSDQQFNARLLHGVHPNQGIVQVRSLTGEWSFIHPTSWSRNNSHVLCQQLGYTFAMSQSEGEWAFPEDTFPMLQTMFDCTGKEDVLANCDYVGVTDVEMQRVFLAIECGDNEAAQDSTHICGSTCSQETVTRTGCKCDPLCESYGDCCPDFNSKVNCPSGSHAVNESSCTPMPLYHTPPFTSPSNFDVGYFMVSRCSHSWPWVDDDISLACEEEQDEDDPFTFTPVEETISDREIRKVYRNLFCALCNGKDLSQMLAWELELSNSTELIESDNEVLILDVMPPNGTAVPRTCYLNLKAVNCRNHDDVIDGCYNYYAPLVRDSKTYKNIFCAICDNVYPMQYASFNSKLDLPELRDIPNPTCGLTRARVVVSSNLNFASVQRPLPRPPIASDIFILFDFTDENSPSCELGEIFDRFLHVCRLLSCPPGFRLSSGKCEELPLDSPQTIVHEHVFETVANQSDQGIVDCIMSMLNESKFINGKYGNDSMHESKLVITQHMNNTAVVKVENGSYSSAIERFNAAMATSRSDTDGERICNISSLVLIFKDSVDDTNGADIGCTQARNVQMTGCLSPNSNYSMGINNTTQLMQYTWEEKENCYVVTIAWNECDTSKISGNHCPEIILTHDEYDIIFTNKSASIRHKASGRTLASDQYDVGENETIRVCSSLLYNYAPNQTNQLLGYISFVCFILSLVATLLTFISYCVFKELRNITGLIVINFLVAFFVAQLMFLLAPYLLDPPALCLSSAIINHIAWLGGFFWMNALSLVTTNTLSRKTVAQNKTSELCVFLRYMAYAWGGPLLIAGVCISLHFCDCTDIAPIYGQKGGSICWLIGHDGFAVLWGFAAPVASLLIFNMSLFIYAIAKFRQKMASVRSTKRSKRVKMELSVYVKLTILMGLPWLLGFVQSFVTNIILNYIYTILNSLQGVFIFWALVLTGRAGKLWRQKMCRKRETSATGSSKNYMRSTVKTITTSFTTPSAANFESTASEK